MAKGGVPDSLQAGGKALSLPAFLPDATRAVLRGLDPADLAACGIEAVMVNAFHLMTEPGPTVVAAAGGAGMFMGWDGPVFSDSGGFQLMSMIYRDKSAGTISDGGVTFYRSPGGRRKRYELTPESCIGTQFALGTDAMFCLDDCPKPRAGREAVAASVRRTIEWAKRCRAEFDRLVEGRRIGTGRPLLFAVVQGGSDRKERERCFTELARIGFDGYGFGGWPLDDDGNVDTEIMGFTASLAPPGAPLHALGVGNPAAVVAAYRLGYRLFDCSMPSRDGRHGRLWSFAPGGGLEFVTLNIGGEKNTRDGAPVSEGCECAACARHSRAYLHHLFAVDDSLGGRLATIHNLRTWAVLMKRLPKE